MEQFTGDGTLNLCDKCGKLLYGDVARLFIQQGMIRIYHSYCIKDLIADSFIPVDEIRVQDRPRWMG